MEHATDTDIFLQNLAANICKQFGRNCEVAVHEFQGDTLVIKHIVNGYVTGRHAGDISTNAFLDEFVEKDFIRNPIYHMTTKDGGPIIVQGTMAIASMILMAAGLSFIGLGVQPPQPEWGTMLNQAREYMREYPYLVTIPGICIAVSVFSINLVGDGLRDALDPKLKN